MNILIPDSWLREYLDTKATPKQLKDCLSLCGPSIEKINRVDNDYIYNIEVTTNRPDLMSVLGITREATAILPRFGIAAKLNNETTRLPAPERPPAMHSKALRTDSDGGQVKQCNNLPRRQAGETIKAKSALTLKVKITNPKLCPRFSAIILTDVKVEPSPKLIQDRLKKSGIRALNNVIDVSNYLMRLFGQPVHTFDYDKIKKATMILRESRKGEKITTLDGKTFSLPGKDIVIEDGKGRLIDLCGIMGAENSAVDRNTKRVLLFVQNYHPIRIRKTSMVLAQRTEAATLFEKNLNSENILPTILYGIKLLKETVGAKQASKLIDIYPKPYKPKKITVSTDFINQRLGINLKPKEIIDILKSLSFGVIWDPSSQRKIGTQDDKNQVLIIIPPSFRHSDIDIPEDLVEEVARIYGYHNLPSRLMTGDIPITDKPKNLQLEQKVKQILKYWGYTETYHYSFISKTLIERTGLSVKSHLRVTNPLTEEIEYMRISLIPSILTTIENNQHLRENLSPFELAKVYIPKPNGLPDEKSRLVIVNQSSFFKLKGVVEQILNELGITNYSQQSPSWDGGMHPKQTITFSKNKDILAKIGKIHPKLAASFNIKKDLFMAEIDFDHLVKYSSPIKKYTPIPLYPPAIEDLTLKHSPETQIGPVIEEIYKISPLVNKVEFIGKYKNTTTLKITYLNPKKNLAGEEIKKVREKILSTLKNKFNFHLK